MSHLSFVLAFIFLETDDFPSLLTVFLIGALAKESVLAMAGYYILFGRKGKHYPLRAAILLIACSAVYIGVRLLVLGRLMGYQDISGVPFHHVTENLSDSRWPILFVLTAAALLPILAVNWKVAPAGLKRLALYLLPVLFVASAVFSWLAESRDFMPVVFVLAVIAGDYFAGFGRTEGPQAGLRAAKGKNLLSSPPIRSYGEGERGTPI